MESETGHAALDGPIMNSLGKEQAIENVLNACVTPTVGMEFESDEDALRFYNSYAKGVGFETRIRASQKSERHGRSFVHFCCKKEGFKTINRFARTTRPDTRCGCLAGMKVKLIGSGKWKVLKVNLEHNHLINPIETQYSRSHRHLDNGVKRRSKLGLKSGQRVRKAFQGYTMEARGHKNLTLAETDCQNHVTSDKQLEQATMDFVDEEQATESDLGTCLAPAVGMEFESDEDAFRFFNLYAKREGFETRIRASQKSKRRGRCFVHFCCKKEGFKKNNGAAGTRRPDTRCGCLVNMKVRLIESVKWKVVDVNLHHNHLLGSTKAQHFLSHKYLDTGAKKKLKLGIDDGQLVQKTHQESVLNAGQLDHLTFVERNCQNHVTKVRQLELCEGDIEAINKFFSCMQARSSNFFFMTDQNKDGHLRNVFWADARSRVAYEYFGDVVMFDTTYLTNKYDLKLALFVGVDHHGQSVLFGCGLLEGETISSFIWLFKAWLMAMSDHAPNAIITDHSEAIQAAVAEVFPSTHHRFCLWCIMKRVPEKFATLVHYEAIKNDFKKIVSNSLKIDEFEQQWNEMIRKYKLECNRWLKMLYQLREKWVPVFLKHTFWAGMSTTQASHSISSYFDEYVNPRTCLKEFVEQYELALEKNYKKESLSSFSNFNLKPILCTHHNFEIQLAPIYTSGIFKKFQEEVNSTLCQCSNLTMMHVDGAVTTYMVKEMIVDENGNQLAPKEYEVCYNKNEVEVTCICGLFQFEGFLCRHALYTLSCHGVDKVPSRYIISRWRKDFKRIHFLGYESSDLTVNNPVYCYDLLCQKVTQFVEEGAISERSFSIALQLLEEGLEKVYTTNVCASNDTNHHESGGLNDDYVSEQGSDGGSTNIIATINTHVPDSCEVVDHNVQMRTDQTSNSRFVSEEEQTAESKQKKLFAAANTTNVSDFSVISLPLVTPASSNLFKHCLEQERLQELEGSHEERQSQLTQAEEEIHLWKLYRKFDAARCRNARRQHLHAARKCKAKPCIATEHAASHT